MSTIDRMPSSPRGRAVERWAVLVLLLALAAQSVASMRLLSATSDEVSHLPAGYTYLRTGEIRLNPQHPPLVKELCALPLLALAPRLDLEHPSWTREPPDEWDFGRAFLFGNDADRLLFWGRMPIVALAVLLGFVVWRFARELYGGVAGLAALFLVAFSPNVLAHSHLVTMDLALACFSTAMVYFLWRWVRGRRVRDLALAGISLGLALATKFSAGLLVPAAAVLLALACVPAAGGARARPVRPVQAALALAGLLVVAAAVVWAAYLFPGDPRAYLAGLTRVNVDHRPDYPFYLLGEFRYGGFWYYFLVAFLLKTPLPTLILVVLAGITRLRRPAESPLDAAFLVVPVAAWVVVTSALADDIGLRYLLPVYPLLFVGVAPGAARLLEGRPGRVTAAALAVWYLGSAAFIYPDHLAYFNEAAGGPGRGHEYLDDSNVEWGEGLKRLAVWVDRRGLDSIKLRYPWSGSPEYYGIPYENLTHDDWVRRPSPGVYAMSRQALIRGRFPVPGLASDWLTRYRPVDRIGYSIYVYEFEP